MSARTPEGKLKEKCRALCKKLGLFWANVEGKGFNGFPDTMVGLYPPGSGVILLEAKRLGKMPTEQQYKRIGEINMAGGQADWYDNFDRFCELIGYDPDL